MKVGKHPRQFSSEKGGPLQEAVGRGEAQPHTFNQELRAVPSYSLRHWSLRRQQINNPAWLGLVKLIANNALARTDCRALASALDSHYLIAAHYRPVLYFRARLELPAQLRHLLCRGLRRARRPFSAVYPGVLPKGSVVLEKAPDAE